ncbi:5-deoxy-glucuronate isomerase [Bacillus sp. B15-48]|uniref:5-deoxy-glucuronate isomerase n=1 Tax=Bacillus sp. B15-48 TaxID=1548601 RepID=UPI0019400907|nr:5-deoxy-glucuronate isomerase [Bacillus sp. B15-48]MBM4761132.1 hypothetical protein [Bacillus sp. B15-48]
MKYYYNEHEQLEIIQPVQMGLEYTSVQRIEVSNKKTIESVKEELCFVVIQGEVHYQCGETNGTAGFKDVIYLPPQSEVHLSSEEKAVIIRYGAPSDMRSEFAHIQFDDVDKNPKQHHVYGKKETNCERHVWDIITADFPSSRFLVGMCESDVGGWTAWPPHEHGDKREEVYVYFNMGNAFGIQCVYEDMGNPLEVALVRDGDLVSVPRGYHPNVGCPGGKLSYIYCMVSKKPGDRNFMDLQIQEIFGEKFE